MLQAGLPAGQGDTWGNKEEGDTWGNKEEF
jgi:hypothetical protein